MFKSKACEVLKVKEFTKVNDCFQHERNEAIGHYRQTLISRFLSTKIKGKILLIDEFFENLSQRKIKPKKFLFQLLHLFL